MMVYQVGNRHERAVLVQEQEGEEAIPKAA